jgi:ATP-dependent Clp protease ATP-binding subunit ClpA
MDTKLQKAIDLIEEAGGIVMMQSTEETEAMMREAELIESTAKEQAENDQYKREYESRKADAFEEFDELLGSKNFSMNAVDDICYGNGIDMDDIEEYINSHY